MSPEEKEARAFLALADDEYRRWAKEHPREAARLKRAIKRAKGNKLVAHQQRKSLHRGA